MKSKFEKEYETRAEKLLNHHMQVVKLAMEHLSPDEFHDFLAVEDEMFNRTLKGILVELDEEFERGDLS